MRKYLQILTIPTVKHMDCCLSFYINKTLNESRMNTLVIVYALSRPLNRPQFQSYHHESQDHPD